jgi:transcriptional regulator with XRE-family HTH domain
MERIRELRAEMGISQVKLAVRADMDPATLNRLEQGKANPNLKTLERLAAAMDVEVADFFPKGDSRSQAEPKLFDGRGEADERTPFEPEIMLEQLHIRGIPTNASEVSILGQCIGTLGGADLVEDEPVAWERIGWLLAYVLAEGLLTEDEVEVARETTHRHLVEIRD